jgi:hypothetical protein
MGIEALPADHLSRNERIGFTQYNEVHPLASQESLQYHGQAYLLGHRPGYIGDSLYANVYV